MDGHTSQSQSTRWPDVEALLITALVVFANGRSGHR
jgi:hypothetical protein